MSPPSLPTPAPSTDIPPGKRTSFSTIDNAFSLPPAAIANAASKPNSSGSSTSSAASAASDSSYHPISPLPIAPSQQSNSRAEKTSRRRSSTANNQTSSAAGAPGGYTLPPPPTRSRKIIQMKPRTQTEPQSSSTTASPILNAKPQPSPSLGGQTTPKASSSTSNNPATGTKRKQGNGPTTAAGRKIARKTAHSLIERRRRSKMNEEFGVLKDMIPACAGQDMHKLQVLSASIEYMRYLEHCLDELKKVHAKCPPQNTQPTPISPFRQPSSVNSSAASAVVEDENDEDEDEDEDMADADDISTPQHRASGYSSHHPSISPAILPSSTHTTPQLYPSTHTSPAISSCQIRATYSAFTPTFPGPGLPSPAFPSAGPQASFKLTSPALGPQRQPPSAPSSSSDARPPPQSQAQPAPADRSAPAAAIEKDDHEATAALLMLNSDRRSWSGLAGGSARTPPAATTGAAGAKGDGGRGMSVRDLLSG